MGNAPELNHKKKKKQTKKLMKTGYAAQLTQLPGQKKPA